MKTGIELISDERDEQIEKHGFDKEHDSRMFNERGELKECAAWLISQTKPYPPGGGIMAFFPQSWNGEFRSKMEAKTNIEKLIVAGALIAAEIDRIQNMKSL